MISRYGHESISLKTVILQDKAHTMLVCLAYTHPTRDVRNELLIVLYLDIHVGHHKKQYIPISVYSRSTQRYINEHVRLNVRHKISHINTRSH